jgi:branched-chain amino acid transport system permease protein
LGLGEISRLLLLNWEYAGGALGLSGIPERGDVFLLYGVLIVLIIAFFFVGRSRIGRAMEAMREDETAAGVMGVNVPRYKLATLVTSAMLAGLAGCLSAHLSSFIGPNEYGFEEATTILSFALLGGIGTPLGPVAGAAILTLLPEVLRFLADYRLMINGAIIVIAVLFMPRGLLSWRMKRTV